MKQKTLLLINPVNQLRPGFLINTQTRNQPLSLGIIADLVGLTAFTNADPRAY